VESGLYASSPFQDIAPSVPEIDWLVPTVEPAFSEDVYFPDFASTGSVSMKY